MIYMLISRGRRIQVSQDSGELSLSCTNNSSFEAADVTCRNKRVRVIRENIAKNRMSSRVQHAKSNAPLITLKLHIRRLLYFMIVIIDISCYQRILLL